MRSFASANRSIPQPFVMLVDDDRVIAEMYSAGLSDSGFRVQAMHDAADFFRALDDEIPNAIVLDWEMPGISGRDVLRLLRGDARTAPVPVVFLSNHRREDVESAAEDVAWLVKAHTTPYRLARLLRNTISDVSGAG